MQTILIVDDEATARYAVRRALEPRYRVVEADSVAQARQYLERERADLLLLDVVMPGEGGLELLRWLGEQQRAQPVIMVSALDTARTAVEALKLGAADYLVKGFDIEELRRRVGNVLKLSELGEENARLRRQLARDGQFGAMIGQSAEMRRVFEMADRVAPTDATVLILGESGTGKDLLAQEIHARSPRAERPFVAVNCAALPEDLIESELFGAEKGAYTGATQRKGKFEQAHGGTLFLDEIGDMNPKTQAKVLRALESRTIERLGGSQSIAVDVRVISATHRDLPAEVAAGRFRGDLYFRLRVVTLELPPLRAHREDIPLLSGAFLQQLGARHGRNAQLSREALALVERYAWPGNARELKNALERSLVLVRGGSITPDDLPDEVGARRSAVAGGGSACEGDGAMDEADFREAKRRFEIAFLQRKLKEFGWNVKRTAAAVGLQRQSLQEKLRELGIHRPGKE